MKCFFFNFLNGFQSYQAKLSTYNSAHFWQTISLTQQNQLNRIQQEHFRGELISETK